MMLLSSIFFLGFACSVMAAQEGASTLPRAVIRIDVNLVQVDAVVTDSKGRHIPNLTTEDFTVLQDGRPQVISNLSYISIKPAAVPNGAVVMPGAPPAALKPADVQRAFAFVVDDLGLSFDSIVRVREGLKQFADQQMEPGDLVAIVRTSAGMGALQQFTADKRLLHAAIDRIKFSMFTRGGVFSFAPVGSPGNMNTFRMPPSMQAGTLGAIRYVVDGLSRLPGRKSVVVFSESMRLSENSNVNPEVLESMRRLIDAANRSSVVIHTVDPRGIQVFAYGAADNVDPSRRSGLSYLSHLMGRSAAMASTEAGLAMLAEETGGIFVHDDNFMDDAIRQVVGDSTGYYLIGYHPDAATFESPRFHTLKVLVRPAGLHVRTRSGFFGVPDSVKSGTPAAADALEQAMA